MHSERIIEGEKEWAFRVWALGEGEFDSIVKDAQGNPLLFVRTQIGTIQRLTELMQFGGADSIQWRFYPGKIGQPPDPLYDVNIGGVGYSGVAILILKVQVRGTGTIGLFNADQGGLQNVDSIFGIYKTKKVSRLFNRDGQQTNIVVKTINGAERRLSTPVYSTNPVHIFIDDMLDPEAMGMPEELLNFRELIDTAAYYDEEIEVPKSARSQDFFYRAILNDSDPSVLMTSTGIDNLDLFFSPNPARGVKTGPIPQYFTILITYKNTDGTLQTVSTTADLPSGSVIRPEELANSTFTVPLADPDVGMGTLRARFMGQVGVGSYTSRSAQNPPSPDGFADIHIRANGIDPTRAIKRIRVTTSDGDIWQAPTDGTVWSIQISSWFGPSPQQQRIKRGECHIAYPQAMSPSRYFDYLALHIFSEILYGDDGKITIAPADRQYNVNFTPGSSPEQKPVIKRYSPDDGIHEAIHLTDGSDGIEPNIDGDQWSWATKDERELINELQAHFRDVDNPAARLVAQQTVIAQRERLQQRTRIKVQGELQLSGMNENQARRVTELTLRRMSDLRKIASGPVTRAAWHVLPGDIVTLTLKAARYVKQPFMVLERVEDPVSLGANLTLVEYAEAYSDTEFGPITSPVRGLFPSQGPPHVQGLALRPFSVATNAGPRQGFVGVRFVLIGASRYRVYWKVDSGSYTLFEEGTGKTGEVTEVIVPVSLKVADEPLHVYCFKVVAVVDGIESNFGTAPEACIGNDDPAFISGPPVITGDTLVFELGRSLGSLLSNFLSKLFGPGVSQLLRNPLFILLLAFWIIGIGYFLFVKPRKGKNTVELLHSGESVAPNDFLLGQNVTDGFDENDEIIASAEFAVETNNIPPQAFQTGSLKIGFEFYDSPLVDSNGMPLGRKLGEQFRSRPGGGSTFSETFTTSALVWTKRVTDRAKAPPGTKMVRFTIAAGPAGYKLGGRKQTLLMRNPSMEIVTFPEQDDTVHAGLDRLLAINQAQALSSNIAPANLLDNTDLRRGAEGWTIHPAVDIEDRLDGKWFVVQGPLVLDGDSLIERSFSSPNMDDTAFIFSCLAEREGQIERGDLAVAIEVYSAEGKLIGGNETKVDFFGNPRAAVKAIVPSGAALLKVKVRRAFVTSFGWGEFGHFDFGMGTSDVLVLPEGTKVRFTRFQLERALPGQEEASAYTPDATDWSVAERAYLALAPDGSVISRIGMSGGDQIRIEPGGRLTIIDAAGNVRAPQVRIALRTDPFTASHGEVVPFASLRREGGEALPAFSFAPFVVLNLDLFNASVDELGSTNVTTTGFTVHALDKATNNQEVKTTFTQSGDDPVFIYNKDQTTGYQPLFNALVRTGVMPWTITDCDATVKFTPPSASDAPALGRATLRLKAGLWDGATFTARSSIDLTFDWARGGASQFKTVRFTNLNQPDNRTELWFIAYYFGDTADQTGSGSTVIKQLTKNPTLTGYASVTGGDYTGTFALGGTFLRVGTPLAGAGYAVFDTVARLTEAPRSAVTKIKVDIVLNGQRKLDFDVFDLNANNWITIINDTKVGAIAWETTEVTRFLSTQGITKCRIRIPPASYHEYDYFAITYFVDPALYLGSGQFSQLLMMNSAGDIPLSNLRLRAQIFELAGER